ncbi:MAG: ribosome silencing factor [Saprospiraceae bacterium]|nr:ribosome silencing factor [Saprospiraceae bacterium]
MSKTQSSVSSVVEDQENLNDLIVDSIQDIKGKNIVKLDLRHLEDRPADYFIVCEGESSIQVKAIAENISQRAKEELSVRPSHVEGKQGARWILVDFFDVVAHIFHPEAREYYQVEELWNDAHTTEYNDL